MSDIRNANNYPGEEDQSLPEGAMRYSETTTRGRFYYSENIDNEKNEFFENQFERHTSPALSSQGSYNASFVTGVISGDGALTGEGRLDVMGTITSLSGIVDGYVKNFKASNSLNVAFVDKINITVSNSAQSAQWQQVANSLADKYNTQVDIKLDPKIQIKDNPKDIGTVSPSYGHIDYKVSGVKDGNKKNAEAGAQ